MQDLKKRIEAILFSVGKKIKIEEIAKLANTSTSMATQALTELKHDYVNKDSSLIVVDEGYNWKIIVKDEFLPVVKKIVTETELSKTVMETLAVIAFKYPIKQSDLIKIRTNKAYDHLKELEEMGYITRQKYGRSKLIKLTQKFFEYFDLREEQLKDKFHDFQSIASAIEKKEKEIEDIKEEQAKKAKEEKAKDEKIKKEIDSLDEDDSKVEVIDEFTDNAQEISQDSQGETELEVVDKDNQKIAELEGSEEHLGNLEVVHDNENPERIGDSKDRLGNLEVIDEPPEEEIQKENERIKEFQDDNLQTAKEIFSDEGKEENLDKEAAMKDKESKEQSKSAEDNKTSGENQKKESQQPEGIKLSPEQEKKAEKKVEEILHPKKEPE